jgi:radical SAM superfamily enzyme YgiQ (UPF0313 family)
VKVLLAACNARFTHSSLAIRCLRTAIEDAGSGHDLVLAEYQINQPRLNILQDLAMQAPDVLMLSVSIWSAALVRSLLTDIRSLLPECRIILGGPEASWSADTWFRDCPVIDLIVAGPGEAAAASLARHDFDIGATRLAHPRAFRAVGAGSEGPGGWVMNLPPQAFATSPFPYREPDFASLAGHYLYYESSRGCPFACSYCLSSRDDQILDQKPVATVRQELGCLLAARPMLVKFVDRTFNADPPRAREIWQFLAEQDNGETRFHFEIHPALLEEADFRLLAAVRRGLFQFEAGVQTVNPKALAAISRPVDWPAARLALERLAALGRVHIHLDLIAGLPGEGLAEIGCSFDAILDLAPDHFQLGFLKVLPGTRLHEQAAGFGLVHQSQAPYEILCNRWLALADLAELRQVEELLEASWNAGVGRGGLMALRQAGGSWFGLYRLMAAHARRTGYDVRTRQASKVRAFMAEALPGFREE